MKLTPETTQALMIDFQEKLVPAIAHHDELVKKTALLVHGLNILQVPLLVSQQYTKGLGPTIPELQHAFSRQNSFYEKLTFSCLEDDAIRLALDANRPHVIMCGIESHICVAQTVLDLIRAEKDVYVVADCVGSRHDGDKDIALRRMEAEGAHLTTAEAVLFELLQRAGTDSFKQISKLVK